jgi:hypothetical protein
VTNFAVKVVGKSQPQSTTGRGKIFMPEKINCLTCAHEPVWECVSVKPLEPRLGLHDGGHMFRGECRWGQTLPVPVGIFISRYPITKVGETYVEGSKGEITACPAWASKAKLETVCPK